MTIATVAVLVYLALGENTDNSYAHLLDAAKCSTPTVSLVLRKNRFGIRGVFPESNKEGSVQRGDILLAVPLSSCVKDLKSASTNADKFGDGDSSFRLAKEFLEFDNKQLLQAWSKLLPSPLELRKSLPLHWQDAALQATGLSSFHLQAIANKNTQTAAVRRLGKTLVSSNRATSLPVSIPVSLHLGDILDLCNTRMCRVESEGLMGNILAPGFDMINHTSHGGNNASYELETIDNQYFLVVRSKRELDTNEEILIDYGEGTRDLNCLHNYGFLPRDIEAGAEILYEKNNFVLNFRRAEYGIGVDFAKVASSAVENKKGESSSSELGEAEAVWIIGRIDEAIIKANAIEGQNIRIVGMETALMVKRVTGKLLLRCREGLVSERIRNPLRKLSLTLSKPRIT